MLLTARLGPARVKLRTSLQSDLCICCQEYACDWTAWLSIDIPLLLTVATPLVLQMPHPMPSQIPCMPLYVQFQPICTRACRQSSPCAEVLAQQARGTWGPCLKAWLMSACLHTCLSTKVTLC